MRPFNKLLFLFSFLVCIGSHAQDFGASINLGLTTSQVFGDNQGGFNKAGVHAGVFVDRALKSMNGKIEFGLQFSQKGSRMSADIREKTGQDYKIQLAYLEIPFHYRLKIYPRVEAIGGLSAGILVSEYEGDADEAYPGFLPFNPLEIAGRLGVSYELSSSSKISAILSQSLSPIRSHAFGATNRLNYGMLNNVIEFGYSYHFGTP